MASQEYVASFNRHVTDHLSSHERDRHAPSFRQHADDYLSSYERDRQAPSSQAVYTAR